MGIDGFYEVPVGVPSGLAPLIRRSSSPILGDVLLAIAARDGITVAIETGAATHTDADDVFTAGHGIATGIICIPLRYMHSAGEIVQLSDVYDTSRLIEAYARSLGAETSFLR